MRYRLPGVQAAQGNNWQTAMSYRDCKNWHEQRDLTAQTVRFRLTRTCRTILRVKSDRFQLRAQPF